jgi:Arc/MetJ-type ribon-helix-helix transcriptional regulator
VSEVYDNPGTDQVPTRFDDRELAVLDQLVADGAAGSRSELIRLAVQQFNRARHRRKVGESIAEAYRQLPQTDSEIEWAMANAIALTEAEP